MSHFEDVEQNAAAQPEVEVTNGDIPTVHLGLTYDPGPDPARPVREARLGLIPPWFLGVGLIMWGINWYYRGR